ncbi:MAG: glucose-6-phosphate isomerase, partial [Sphingomonas sp.]
MAADWTAIEGLPSPRLETLFADDAERLARFTVDVAGIHFDWSKTHLTEQAVAAFEALAKAQDLHGKREALFSGKVINTTEGRAVTHVAERGEGSEDDVAAARILHARMRALIDAIEGGALGEIRHVLHVGIGGSALGPDLLVDALGRESGRYD